MTNLVVLTFPDEAKAIQASHKLTELESFGDISIFEKAIIKKGANGEYTSLQSESSDGLRLVSGMALGTLIGAIGGPVGMMIGMLSGTAIGAVVETDYVDFSEDFVNKVSDRLKVGDVAILAEISEDSPAFIDGSITQLGGSIFRSNVDEVYSDYEDDQVKEFDKEIADDRKQFKAAVKEDKERIEKRIEALKEKRRKRIASLKDKATDRKKARIENAISNEQAKVEELKRKLNKLN
ncbi:MAG: hypothetical protein C5B52_12230 [Bacteroidetes bacterium]|nr:MAG: hypothetical protein C5B52_12230 [Bacteroidota bacterium]